ncbi:amidophosphoribosyltransferase [Catenisphaera adipataccumulans]|jgi:amidophosphoribosyltransferase|uniref:Amidophosphoribosyltransferase n=1 Tax=Catenisphaera adipataccumulans TaxID=700500 RepID=A0A7W8CVR2_9FIRM|nr:amidophosphoribosyltransferase [Catenisphaera adipataccumulans]MBB5182475.1 amidophosphoribosyltransferase [Catenisphaera adipataccumulans]
MAEIHEECGVFGVYHVENAAMLEYYGLHSLQHRGQESSGIAVSDGETINSYKGKGLTVDVFQKEKLSAMKGNTAIGHVRYSTAGGQEAENIQPIVSKGHNGCLAVSHNGQIDNDVELRLELENHGAIFQGTGDSEVILHQIQYERGTLLERITQAARKLDGAFSFLVMDEDRIYAVRDRYGIRPLSYAPCRQGYVISSETCAFEVMGIYESYDLKPGEIVEFSKDIVKHYQYTNDISHHMCAMEYIYFARPDSVVEGKNVHTFRKESGAVLARKDQDLHADIVVGVPDSSLSAAIGYAEESGLPFETGLFKNRYVGRTFIQPTQAMRDQSVRMKLSPVESVVSGKSVVMIDDSIVRGTTSRRIVQLLKSAGAKEVHVRIASPVFAYPCFYGVDTSTRAELIGARLNVEEICDYIKADSLRYLEVEDMREVAGQIGLCLACFDGKYVTNLYTHGKELED